MLLMGCEVSADLMYLRYIGEAGVGKYYSDWIFWIGSYLFWIYAIVFGILACGRNRDAFIRHIVFTLAIYVTFQWSVAPVTACILPYYIGMPLIYVPQIKSHWIEKGIFWTGTIISWLYLCYMDWLYENFSLWIADSIVWGVSAVFFVIFISLDLNDRCPHCGYFALSWKGRSNRYNKALKHFYILSNDGSDRKSKFEEPLGIPKGKEVRCGHCLKCSNGGL